MKKLHRKYWITVLLIAIGIVLLFLFAAFQPANQPASRIKDPPAFGKGKQPIVSSDYTTQAEKISVLKTRFTLPGTVQAAEFSLFEMTFAFMSAYHYRIAIKMPPSEIDRWLKSITYLPWEKGKNNSKLHVGDQFFNTLLLDPAWKPASKPEYLHSVNNMKTRNSAIIYRREGIILLTMDHTST